MATPRPYGIGPYGTSVYSTYRTYSIGGVAFLAFDPTGSLARTWQQPTGMCETGTWTLTTLPSGPVNDQLELV